MSSVGGIMCPDYHSTGNPENANEKAISRCWYVRWNVGSRQYSLYVYPNFKTDGASIPRFLWRIEGHPWESPNDIPAIAHDWLYAAHVTTRAFADKTYRALQKRVGIGWIRRTRQYWSLRLFGRRAWRSHGIEDQLFTRKHGAFGVIGKTRKERNKMKKLMIAAFVMAFAVGCGKTVDVEGKGMYANANSATVGIGEFEVVTYPEGVEGARIKYEEDTPWLSPGTKTHAFKIDIVGTNACGQVSVIVSNICAAFISSAPKIAAINNGIMPRQSTNTVNDVQNVKVNHD